jgi:hypothetical protein
LTLLTTSNRTSTDAHTTFDSSQNNPTPHNVLSLPPTRSPPRSPPRNTPHPLDTIPNTLIQESNPLRLTSRIPARGVVASFHLHTRCQSSHSEAIRRTEPESCTANKLREYIGSHGWVGGERLQQTTSTTHWPWRNHCASKSIFLTLNNLCYICVSYAGSGERRS